MKKFLLVATKLAVSAFLLWLVISRVEPAGIVARLRATDWRWLLPSMLLGPVIVLLSAGRWSRLSQGLVPYGQAVRYTWIGLFFGTFLPGLVGGDVAKGVSLAAKDSRTRTAHLPVSILADKLVGFWVLLLCFAAAAVALLLTQPELLRSARPAVWAAIALAGLGLTGGALACNEHAVRTLTRLLPAGANGPLGRVTGTLAQLSASFVGRARLLVQSALLSLAIHGLNALALWFTLRSLAVPASFFFAAVFYPMLSGLLALPISISGVGVRDVFAASMFAAFGLGSEAGVAFSWLLLGLGLPNAVIGGAIQLWELFSRPAGAKPTT